MASAEVCGVGSQGKGPLETGILAGMLSSTLCWARPHPLRCGWLSLPGAMLSFMGILARAWHVT